MTSGSISTSTTTGSLLLRRVFYLSSDNFTLAQGDLVVSRETGEITVEPGTAPVSAGKKRDHVGNEVPSHEVSWVLDGSGDHQYLVVPALSNHVDLGVEKRGKGFFTEEENATGKLSNLDETLQSLLSKNLEAGVSNITLNLIGETAADKALVETCLKEHKLRGKVHVGAEGAQNIYFRQAMALGNPVPSTSFADDKFVNIGSGNPRLSTGDIWQEYQAITLDLLSRNSGVLPVKAESLLKNAFWGGGKLNSIKTGSAADLMIIKLEPHQKPFQGALSLLLKGQANSVQAVLRRGKFIHLKEELNHQIVPSVSSKTSVNGCEFDSIEEALAEFAKGNFVVVVDNEDRENEGDLIMACEFVTEEKMAFLIRHTSGLVCIGTTAKRLTELELPLMVMANNESFKTAFTISVDYTHGTTTGISAFDRAVTARAIANPEAKAEDFNRPGHMFPLRAAEGGVIRRMGHTEATVDLCKLAGTYPAGILCEIALDNGKMARRDYLRNFATEHGLKMITIADMIEYRKKHGFVVDF